MYYRSQIGERHAITQILRDKTFGEAEVRVISSVFEGILHEMHLASTDPIAKIIAKRRHPVC